MHFRVKVWVLMLALAALFGLAGAPAGAQDKQHVVRGRPKGANRTKKLFERFFLPTRPKKR